MKKLLTLFVALLLLGAVAVSATADATFWEGNPKCSDIGTYDHQLTDITTSGTYDGITFTLNADTQHFDWSSDFPIDAVIAKGGNHANVYYYDPASYGDSDLVAPENNGEQVPALSHAVFCWNDNNVPEFGVIAGAVALLAGIGIVAFRRR